MSVGRAGTELPRLRHISADSLTKFSQPLHDGRALKELTSLAEFFLAAVPDRYRTTLIFAGCAA